MKRILTALLGLSALAAPAAIPVVDAPLHLQAEVHHRETMLTLVHRFIKTFTEY